jgi:hypothetical protein
LHSCTADISCFLQLVRFYILYKFPFLHTSSGTKHFITYPAPLYSRFMTNNTDLYLRNVHRTLPYPTQSVSLLGSWDNFHRRYPMERDPRRGAGQWRGVHSFKDIVCDGPSSSSNSPRNDKRNGGLKMGHEYWYYYELPDGTEICDPSLPTTTKCPYLPGQEVNVLHVPIQAYPFSGRERSASESATFLIKSASGRDDEIFSAPLQTMNPDDKFLKPRPVPQIPDPRALPPTRLNSAPAAPASPPSAGLPFTPTPKERKFDRLRGSRSVSPAPRVPWARNLLDGFRRTRSRSREVLREDEPVKQLSAAAAQPPAVLKQQWIISPEELSRAMTPISGISSQASRPREPSPLRNNALNIYTHISSPSLSGDYDDVDFDEGDLLDDDANFASPTVAREERFAFTALAPPPSKPSSRSGWDDDRIQKESKKTDRKPLPSLPVNEDEATPKPADNSFSEWTLPAPLSFSERSHFSIDTYTSTLDDHDATFAERDATPRLQRPSPVLGDFSSSPVRSLRASDEDLDLGLCFSDDSHDTDAESTGVLSPPKFSYGLGLGIDTREPASPVDLGGAFSSFESFKYSLPDEGKGSEVTLRATDGRRGEAGETKMREIDDLFTSMSWLGDVIS